MRSILLLFFTLFPITALADFKITTLYGQEKIRVDNGKDFTVNLYGIAAHKILDKGYMIGGSILNGYPDNAVADESRYELHFGKGFRLTTFHPYIMTGLGKRDYKSSRETSDYYFITIGTKIPLYDKLALDINYRFRDSDDIEWQTNTYRMGLDYNIDEKVSAGFFVGTVNGDYESTILGVKTGIRF